MHYRDLRGWLDGVDSFGELRVVEGADWNQEIGAVAEVAAQSEPPPKAASEPASAEPEDPRLKRLESQIEALRQQLESMGRNRQE